MLVELVAMMVKEQLSENYLVVAVMAGVTIAHSITLPDTSGVAGRVAPD